jgi:hypothetical protein
MRHALNENSRLPVFQSAMVLLLMVAWAAMPANAQGAADSAADWQCGASPEKNATRPSSSQLEPNPVPNPESQAGPGHHRVILSWNASRSTPDTSKAIAYCIYRSKRQKEESRATNQSPAFGEPERINSKPFTGTICIDNIVEHHANYRYVVTAINSNGITSGPSNEAFASIEANTHPISVTPDSPAPPSCRSESERR